MKLLTIAISLLCLLPTPWGQATSAQEAVPRVTVSDDTNADPTLDSDLASDLKRRRDALAEKMDKCGMVILFSAPQRNKSGDTDYPYRQSSHLFYLTGIRQADTILLLLAHHEKVTPAFLFLQTVSPEDELWYGKHLRREEGSRLSGIDSIYATSEFDKIFTQLMRSDAGLLDRHHLGKHPFFAGRRQKKTVVYLDLQRKADEEGDMSREKRFAQRFIARFPDARSRDIGTMLAELRLVKSPAELARMQKAMRITEQALCMVADEMQSGVYEYEIRALIEYVFQQHEADWAFPAIVASGANTTTLHYPYGRRRLEDGDLLLLDIGASYDYYAADITRTLPVNGTFSKEQRDIYEIVQAAQEAAFATIKPGVKFAQIHQRAVETVSQGLLRLGLIDNVESGAYNLYFMHGTSHWLGLDTHDVGPHNIPLTPGMVLTVEPGIYVSPDLLVRAQQMFGDEFAQKIAAQVVRYQNIGIRIEDDVLVTQNGCKILTSGIPSKIEEVEAWLQKK
jgi:Xaa-Pro aminopeptidase